MKEAVEQKADLSSSVIRTFSFEGRARKKLTETSIAKVPFQLLPVATYPPERLEPGLRWQEQFEENLIDPPTFTIAVVISRGEEREIKELFESLAVQSCKRFQVISVLLTKKLSTEKLERLYNKYEISGCILEGEENMLPGEGFQLALRAASSDYIYLVDEDALLHPFALHVLTKTIIFESPDFLHTNELTVTRNLQESVNYFRKSKLDTFTLLSTNIIDNSLVFSKDIAEELAGDTNLSKMGPGFEKWYLVARLQAAKIKAKFIPLGLYVSREKKCTEMGDAGVVFAESAQHIITQYGKAVGAEVTAITQIEDPERLIFRPQLQAATGAVQVVVPFRNKAELTISCVDKLKEQECFSELVVSLVDNGSSKAQRAKIDAYLLEEGFGKAVQVVEDSEYFNYARVNNAAAEGHESPYILFLNNDVLLDNPDAIGELRDWCAIEKVGAVGGLLHYESGDIQSAGINFDGIRPRNATSREQFSHMVREVNGVSFAFALVKREAFAAVHGLDELICPNGFGDTVFCNRIRKLGYHVVFTPFAQGTHFESASRDLVPEELEVFEMEQSGLRIADDYDDFDADCRPNILQLTRRTETPLYQLVGRISNRPKLFSAGNRVASALLRTGRAFAPRK